MAALIGGLVMGSKASAVVTTLGTDIAIKTLTSTTSSIGSVISYLTTNTKPGASDISSMLSSLDLEFTVTIIECVIKEYVEVERKKELVPAIQKAIIGVNEILECINKELNAIKEAIEYHNSKYLKNWRSFSWNGNTDSIRKHNEILKNRYQMLLELLKIHM